MEKKLASQKQIRLFFLLSSQLGYEAEKIKDAGKKYFKKDHFNELTNDEISFLIDKLLEKTLRS
jgi:hypothetical protein